MSWNVSRDVRELIEPSVLRCGTPVYPARAVMWDGRVFEKVYFIPAVHQARVVNLVEFTRRGGEGDPWIELGDVKKVGRSAKRLPIRVLRPIAARYLDESYECRGHTLTVVTALGTWQTWWLLEYADFFDFAWYVPQWLIVKAHVGRAKRVDEQKVDWKLCLV